MTHEANATPRILVDTNILIDFYQDRRPFSDLAVQLMVAESFGDVELWTSAKSFTDVFYVLSRRCEDTALQRAFKESLAWLNVCSVDKGDIERATERAWPDFEDCLVSLAAEKVGADFLVTRDARGFERSRVPALSPQELFDYLERERGITYDTMDW